MKSSTHYYLSRAREIERIINKIKTKKNNILSKKTYTSPFI